MVIDKLFTLNLAPDVWKAVLSPDGSSNSPRHTVYLVADTLVKVAHTLGLGDPEPLGSDPGNPLLVSMIDGWKGKLAVTIDFPGGLNEKYSEQAWTNVNHLLDPMTNKSWNNPRSGKFLLHITVDPKAAKLGFALSKDATRFHFTVPAYTGISQNVVQRCLEQGR